jgi:hypothetical protein
MESLVGWVLFWGTIAIWDAISVLFLMDCIRVFRRTGREQRVAQEFRDGRLLVAKHRRKTATWFVVGSSAVVLIGAVSTLNVLVSPPEDPVTNFFSLFFR